MGFISELPTELVAAFRATLEEVAEADVILHVRDAAHPDTAAQRADVLAVLDGMAREGTLDPAWPARTIEVLNKADLLGGVGPGAGARRLRRRVRRHRRGAGRPARRHRRAHRAGMEQARLRHPGRDGARLAWLYQHGEVLDRDDGEDGVTVTVRLLPADRARFEQGM